MYRRLFQGIPTRPILIIALLMIAVVTALYYHGQYKRCTKQSMLKDQLYTYLEKNVGHTVSLADFVPFTWDRVFVLVNYKPDSRIKGCPFKWDWSGEYRNTLIVQDMLNVIFYTLNKKRVAYIEFSGWRIQVEGIDTNEPLTPETAMFAVQARGHPYQHVLLEKVISDE